MTLFKIDGRRHQTLLCMFVALLAVTTLAGCRRAIDDGIEFLDEAPSQSGGISDFSMLQFTEPSGQTSSITSQFDSEYLVLVITRGFNGAICLYCSSQTSKWARRYSELEDFNADLAVVFPTLEDGDKIHVSDLEGKILGGEIANESIPYPILLDIKLSSVEQLGLRAELAKPATYIVNRQGKVVYAYVGQSIADRPSVDAVLDQLQRLRDQ